ncbi:hypothetical protein D3OALGA1CA_2722 [Olavius algarvensis associated proteobacterium Delta 3]|nr:hypothetical protein D3OALGB2SA_2682 [Olavius algarvensis associated proteobacterium Delta 3]CAB5123342.1 hypothetical protein D3OALGA1CA_2722 [Olavius algarvensis associated proteobacterium Delta 3]
MNQFKSTKIIFIDQDRSQWERFRCCISDASCLPFCFDRVTPCLDNFASINPDAIVFGNLPFHAVARLIYHIKSINPLFPVLIIGITNRVVNLIELNLFENIITQTADSSVAVATENLLRLIQMPLHQSPFSNPPMIVGESPEIQKLKKIINEAVRSKETVMITGEPGSGKDLVANVIHSRSNLNSGPLVKINVLAISKNQELAQDFSQYVIGEVHNIRSSENTHARTDRSPTILLDGIEHLTPSLQNQVRVLLNNTSHSGLSQSTSPSPNWHVISSSRINMGELIRKRQFDREVLHQLSVYNIKVPPLRERPEDLRLLADFFSNKYSRLLSRPYCTISEETKKKLLDFSWPENIRELESTVKQVVLSGKEELGTTLPDRLKASRQSDKAILQTCHSKKLTEHIDSLFQAVDINSFSLKFFSKQLVSATEKQIITKTLGITKWNRRKAAQLLDISYKSLLNKIKEYQINR